MGKNWVFFHLDTPKTVFLMRNLPINTRNLAIFCNKQGHSFQFPKKSRGDFPLLRSQWAKKDKFCKWANRSLKNLSKSWEVVKIWTIHIRIFKLVTLSFFSVFKALPALNSFNAWISFGIVKPVVTQIFFKTIFFMTYFYVFMHSVKMNFLKTSVV